MNHWIVGKDRYETSFSPQQQRQRDRHAWTGQFGSTSSILANKNEPLEIATSDYCRSFEHRSMRKKCPVLPSDEYTSIIVMFPSQGKETITCYWEYHRETIITTCLEPSPFSMSSNKKHTFTPSCVHALPRFSIATSNLPMALRLIDRAREQIESTSQLYSKRRADWASWNWKRPSSISRPHLRRTSVIKKFD